MYKISTPLFLPLSR